jgi:hypothetical protein
MLVIWQTENNGIAVSTISPRVNVESEIAVIQSKNPNLIFKKTVEASEVEVNYDMFFAAYELDADLNLFHNMVKAREIWKNHIRLNRTGFLEKLDVDYQRALELNDTVAMTEIINKKQILRDATDDPRIEAAINITELKEAYPELMKVS